MFIRKVVKVALGVGMLAAGGSVTLTQAPDAMAYGGGEMLTDRCSGEVAFPPSYGGLPTDQGTAVLKRGANGWSNWVTVRQNIAGDGHFRWYCHSTIGNIFDVGTWRVHVNGNALMACFESAASAAQNDGAGAGQAVGDCSKAISISSSAFHGWTPERSRCNDHSKKLRVRLGPGRLLETQCAGN